MVHLVLLDLAVDLDILEALIEIFLDLLHIVVAGALGLLGLVKFRHLLLNVAHEALILKLSGFVLPLQLLRLRSVLHELSGIIVVIALELLQLTSLLEQCLRGSTALVLKNLFLLEISSLGALHELVAIVLVSHLKVVEGVGQRLDLLLTFSKLSIEFVTVSLELFFLLSGFDDIVGLRVLAGGLSLSRA